MIRFVRNFLKNIKGFLLTRNWKIFVKMCKFDWRWRKGSTISCVAAEEIKKHDLVSLCYQCGEIRKTSGRRCEKCTKSGARHEGDLTNYIYNFMNRND